MLFRGILADLAVVAAATAAEVIQAVAVVVPEAVVV
jgi:hypothetical protein